LSSRAARVVAKVERLRIVFSFSFPFLLKIPIVDTPADCRDSQSRSFAGGNSLGF
jgi:hypothetical protein